MRTWSSLPFDYRRMLRFGAVGLVNTALGYAVILAGLALGLGDILANATGYAVGLVLGFFLNRRWTFTRREGFRPGTALRYGCVFLIAYGINLAIVIAARSAGLIESPLTHLAGICVYSVVFYLGSAHFVFVGHEGRGNERTARDLTDGPRRVPPVQFLEPNCHREQ
ncbi:GtrA family protein [Mesorhizobium sp. ES1-4]|uniref:GtrA family protein n=1 Tax=Mesorhizobium sp. ES1-4 TaxID=2876627 RepID=UPI001CC9252A|nr:GtrA family protein [Mesorhizobium sp. ES1-4]MBZ9796760.1 GtrA family protein [Mesorhizobium sp. ES1-4]